MDPKKEQWKEEVLNSLDQLQAAEPNPFLLAKIKQKISEQGVETSPRMISKPILTMAFAAIVFLISLNFFAISRISDQSAVSTNTTTESELSYSIVSHDYLNIYEDEANFTN